MVRCWRMSRGGTDSKNAKRLKKLYGCKHTEAINLIRQHGLEKAMDILEERYKTAGTWQIERGGVKPS